MSDCVIRYTDGDAPFDLGALAAYLSRHVVGFDGSMVMSQFAGGQSNPTFKITGPKQSYVLRTKPGLARVLLRSAHAVDREYRAQAALAGTDVPVAKMFCLCEDEDIIGRAFYLMEWMDGRVFWDPALPGLTPAQRGAVYDEMNRVIAALHSVDPVALGLADYGRPGNYFARQISRWSRGYVETRTDHLPVMDKLIEWLPAHIPQEDNEPLSIVHGDYRIDNLMFHPTEPRVIAILDWELSTLGHPLADFAYNCMSWHSRPTEFRGIYGYDLAALGIPAAGDYVRAYLRRTGRSITGNWNFYLAYNMFRIAGILQGIKRRNIDGTAASKEAAQAAKGVVPMAELAWIYAGKVDAGETGFDAKRSV